MKNLIIALVDDHQLFREGLNLLLNNISYIDEVIEAGNGTEFLDSLKTKVPDLVFMDIDMPQPDGIETTRRALELYPDLNIIALSMYGEEDYYTRMISAGAKGFMLKNSSITDVEMAIDHVMSGKNYFSQEILEGLLTSINRKTEPATNELTDRELEVLYQICKGLSNQEIADALGISKRTVDKHRENLLSKTYSKNTVGLVMFAIKNNLVEV